jgi:predicted RNA-binding protein associated with RNAse of E/G family
MKKILNIDDFDPLNVDVSFLEEVSRQIPQEGYIDPAMAEHLATSTLRAADSCIDLLAQATLYLSHCDALKRAIRSKVIKALQDQKVPATIIKEVYADDEEYLKATNKHNMALALSTWLENKHDALLKTHHLCKDLIRKTQGVLGASTWESTEEGLKTRPSRSFGVLEEEAVSTSNSRGPGKTSWKV